MGEEGSQSTRRYGGLPAHERRTQRRQRLLEAGLELLGAGGWRATTVSGVCEHARLTPRYFYESFRNRDELLVAIFDGIVDEVAREVESAIAMAPMTMRGIVRANIAAWVDVASRDPRKGRVAFVEALGSEALMRRRLGATRRFAHVLSEQARTIHGLSAGDQSAHDLAGLIVAGGLIETMVEWLEGGLKRSGAEVVEHYTELCVAAIEAATPRGRTCTPRSSDRAPKRSKSPKTQ